MRRYCIDASALFIYLTKQDRIPDLDQIFVEIDKGISKGMISTVNLAEFYRAVSRAFSIDKADLYISWIHESNMKILNLDEDTSLLAALKKQNYARARSPFAWGDSFCLATAINTDCDLLVTADQEFDKVEELPIMRI